MAESYRDTSAVISDCGTYRYVLNRSWEPRSFGNRVLWVMLNPSTADADQDDPTIRRCVGFSKTWGFGHLAVVNLWALRATDPSELLMHAEPSGPHNWAYIESEVGRAALIVAAWGAHAVKVPGGLFRGQTLEAVARRLDRPVVCLGLTKKGHPRHPLYVRSDQSPTPYQVAA